VLFDHPFGAQEKILRKMLSLGPYPLPGSRDTVNNGFFHWWENQYRAVMGPSMRHIVDYGNFASSRFTITIGQSGHRLSRYYSDQVKDWLEGGYHPTLMSRSDIEAAADGKINFIPAGK
jgi:penicillin amidase